MSGSLRYRLRLGQARALRGHRQGLAQPGLQLLCQLEPLPREVPAPGLPLADDAQLVPLAPGLELGLGRGLVRSEAARQRVLELLPALAPLNALLLRLQGSAGWPVYAGGILETLSPASEPAAGVAAWLVFPTFEPTVLKQALPWVFAALGATPPGSQAPPSLSATLAGLEAAAPTGTNTRGLLQAAYRSGVPVLRLPGLALQYGWGARSRWMESSFSDAASVIAARLARDKRAAHALLQRAGFPVPRQAAVRTVEEACRAAAQLGYPVVLKPADLDGGKGVEAGLKDEAALRQCYARAARHGRPLILEQHVPGKDFRLGVVNGQLAWTTYREPAGVWGDGVASVTELVAAANRDPRRGTRSWSQMSPIRLDEEAQALLAEQGVALADVPPAGHFVRLRRAANVSSGGRPLDVLAQVHADNAALAVDVAALFRLDIAGIDFITPDITRSWREVGGMVCEVNGQPQFSLTSPQTATRVVRELVDAEGRIPLIVVLAESGWGAWADTLHRLLHGAGLRTGFALADGCYLGAERLGVARRGAFDDVQALLLDRRVQVLVVATDGRDWLRSGLPVDRVDLVLADAGASPQVLALLATASRVGVWKLEQPLLAARPSSAAWPLQLGRFIVRQAKPAPQGPAP